VRGSRLGELALGAGTWLVGALFASMLSLLLVRGVRATGSWSRLVTVLTGVPRELEVGGGIGPQIYNTVYLALLSLLFAAPIAIAAAAWLARFAREGVLLSAVRVALDSLASLPSVVYGLFGFLLFVVWLKLGYTVLGGALVLACLNLPVLVGLSEEALRSTPRALEEASLALGASRVQTLLRVTLPHAAPGILSAVVLAFGRVFAESAPLIYTAGLSTDPRTPYSLSPLRSGETLAVHLWYLGSSGVVPDRHVIAAASAAVLVVLAIGTTMLGHALSPRRAV